MNCTDIHALFEVYPDLPDEDVRKIQVRKHIEQCRSCREEFEFWEESAELMRSARLFDEIPQMTRPVSSLVMDRIYEAESWRVPVTQKMYLISDKVRRNFTAVIACCLTLFVFSFLFTVIDGKARIGGAKEKIVYGLHPVASAAASSDSMDVSKMSNAVASLTDPFLLKTSGMSSPSDYMLALSIIGTVSALLIMNWWTRIKV